MEILLHTDHDLDATYIYNCTLECLELNTLTELRPILFGPLNMVVPFPFYDSAMKIRVCFYGPEYDNSGLVISVTSSIGTYTKLVIMETFEGLSANVQRKIRTLELLDF